jgi:Zn-dependent protease
MEWIVQLPILFFSVVIHELAHGLTAWSKGDPTAEEAGRLTLNPISHIDPFGTVFLPVMCYLLRLPMFAWAKPVPINPSRLKRGWRDVLLVAFAGPGSNIALALLAAIVYKICTVFAPLGDAFQQTLMQALIFAVSINLFLAFFNLLPIHPLDGSKVLRGLLPSAWRISYDRHAPYGMLILIVLIMTNLMHWLVLVPSQFAFSMLSRIGLIG